MAGWNADTAAGPLGAGTSPGGGFILLHLIGRTGTSIRNIRTGSSIQDTRILSGWNLTVNGQSLEPLAAETKEPYRALFAGRVPRSDGYADSPLIVERLREVGAGILERDHRQELLGRILPSAWLRLSVGADFADLFEVKEARIQRRWDESPPAGRWFADHPCRLAGRPEGRGCQGRWRRRRRRRP